MITIEDFAKLDIKIATIEDAQRIPRADKLVKLIVNLGSEKRQILASIAQYVDDVSSLVGKQIPILTNLEPKEFKGEISQGMMLAISDEDGKIVLFHPEKKVTNGSVVK